MAKPQPGDAARDFELDGTAGTHADRRRDLDQGWTPTHR
jgi:hypothetical protein